LTFVIPTYNRRFVIAGELDRISNLSRYADVIIIDDGSEDGTYAFLKETFRRNSRIKLVRNVANDGSAHCWNVGLAKASTGTVFFLHDDSVELLPSTRQFVETLRASIKKYEIVGVHVAEYEPFRVPFGGAARDVLYQLLYALAGQIVSRNYDGMKQTWFVSGILGVRRDVGLAVGFDDKMLTGNGFREESDFELRARRSGFRILYNPNIGVVHRRNLGGGQSLKAAGDRYTFWAVRNQLIFMRKNRLRLWPIRFALFVLYQMAMHRAKPRVVAEAAVDGSRALMEQKAQPKKSTGDFA